MFADGIARPQQDTYLAGVLALAARADGFLEPAESRVRSCIKIFLLGTTPAEGGSGLGGAEDQDDEGGGGGRKLHVGRLLLCDTIG